jgi:branched-chain amino acid transport system permease protein
MGSKKQPWKVMGMDPKRQPWIDLISRHKKVFLLIALGIVLVIPLIPSNPFYQQLIIMVFFWATLAAAWNLLGGFAGQISLGHAGFFGIGAYTLTSYI